MLVAKVLLATLKNIAWSFFGEKILAKVVWWFLEKAVEHTDNGIDDITVKMAKDKYYGVNQDEVK